MAIFGGKHHLRPRRDSARDECLAQAVFSIESRSTLFLRQSNPGRWGVHVFSSPTISERVAAVAVTRDLGRLTLSPQRYPWLICMILWWYLCALSIVNNHPLRKTSWFRFGYLWAIAAMTDTPEFRTNFFQCVPKGGCFIPSSQAWDLSQSWPSGCETSSTNRWWPSWYVQYPMVADFFSTPLKWSLCWSQWNVWKSVDLLLGMKCLNPV